MKLKAESLFAFVAAIKAPLAGRGVQMGYGLLGFECSGNYILMLERRMNSKLHALPTLIF